jgi:type IV pilus assembly protein PilN
VIRVNLLPQKTKKDRGAAAPSSPKWLLGVVIVILAEAIALVVFHQSKLSELEDQKKKNNQIQAEIQKIKELVKNHKQVKDELAVLRAREEAIAKLQAGRSGPTAVLLELAQMLTPGKGPSIDKDWYQNYVKDNPLGRYNPGWDSRRVWIDSYNEEQRTVRIEGRARDSADVSEVANRLNASSYFYGSRILPGEKKSKGDVAMVNFAIEMKVRY